MVAFSIDSIPCCPAGPRAARIFSASGCSSSAAGRSTAMICAPGERYPRLSGARRSEIPKAACCHRQPSASWRFFAGFFAACWRFLLSDNGRFWRLRLGFDRRTLRRTVALPLVRPRSAHAAATSTIEVHANTPPTNQPLLARPRRARRRGGARIAQFFCWALRHTCLTSLRQAKPGGQPALWLVPPCVAAYHPRTCGAGSRESESPNPTPSSLLQAPS